MAKKSFGSRLCLPVGTALLLISGCGKHGSVSVSFGTPKPNTNPPGNPNWFVMKDAGDKVYGAADVAVFVWGADLVTVKRPINPKWFDRSVTETEFQVWIQSLPNTYRSAVVVVQGVSFDPELSTANRIMNILRTNSIDSTQVLVELNGGLFVLPPNYHAASRSPMVP
jgi:hypothetical protein